MGSGAFLNEAINQLAEAYLQRRQEELGQAVPHADYTVEKQRVKAYIAANNVYGVDLNPVAVELAEISLWLNAIYKDAPVPWFGLNLVNGNSLVGARRQYFRASEVASGQWLVTSGEKMLSGGEMARNESDQPNLSQRATGHSELATSTATNDPLILHFLLPDKGMAAYNNKVIKDLAPEHMATIKAWQKAFLAPFEEHHIDQLEMLSRKTEALWEQHTKTLRELRQKTRESLQLWGTESPDPAATRLGVHDKDRLLNEQLLTPNAPKSSAYRRLKLVMDYWCALWFWPIDQADLLPTREVWLLDLQTIILGEVFTPAAREGNQFLLDIDGIAPAQQELEFESEHREYGFVNVDALCDNLPRLGVVREVAGRLRLRFHHWELAFADVFADRGGFDLILGNPPWVKVEWQEGGILGEREPLFEIRKLSASKKAELRAETLEKYSLTRDYLAEFAEADGTQAFLNGLQNYPLLEGMKANLYKCFLPQAWMIGNATACAGFLHPEGVYDDPKGGSLRTAVYPRLAAHFQFDNELSLFAEVHHCTKFSINIYRPPGPVDFINVANLYSVSTITDSLNHDGSGPPEGIKDEHGSWNTNGHASRLLRIREPELALFASLYDPAGTRADRARLPTLHAALLVPILGRFSQTEKKLGDLGSQYMATVMWDETNSQKDGTIRRGTNFPETADQWILSGPHFFVGNPFNKTPRDVCTLNSHYDVLDLTVLPDDYLPRTNYVPACDPAEYHRRTPSVPWTDATGKHPKVTEFYRHVNREMLSQSGERTLASCIIPPGVGHVNTCIATCFRDPTGLLKFHTAALSLPVDFHVKTTGMGHANSNILSQLPVLSDGKLFEMAAVRALLLNSLSSYYSDLWSGVWSEGFRTSRWAKEDPRLDHAKFANLTQEWTRDCALRTDYERRQALVEIDVLVAMALGLTVDELCAIYRIQFPVLRQNENDTWYDRNGRIIFTCSKGLPGVGLGRTDWEKESKLAKLTAAGLVVCDQDADFTCIKAMTRGTVERTVIDATLPGDPIERTIRYAAPFDRCDREADYRAAWAEFERRELQ